MIYYVINKKIPIVFCIVLLIFNTQSANALRSNAMQQIIDQEVAKKLEQQKQDNEIKQSNNQTNTDSTTNSTIQINDESISSINQITLCAAQDYEKTKMRNEISNLQRNNILLQERQKDNNALVSANFDLKKSKLRESNIQNNIKQQEMINNNINAIVNIDNNLSQERNSRIVYRKVFDEES
ncbi:MAG: hypothetical protein IJ848_01840 [Alphaproteobacteria bacterium]|nr:hypothetical protein [Alphaproteobacteria bacterium]